MLQIKQSQIMSVAVRLQEYYESLYTAFDGITVDRRIGDWLDLRLQQHSFIAGGAIASLLRGETPNDLDVFFHEQRWANAIIDAIEKNLLPLSSARGRIVASTANAVTVEIAGLPPVQFIREALDIAGSPFENPLAAHFDFEHTLGWYNPTRYKLNVPSSTLEAIKQHKLIPTGNGRGLTERYDRALRFKSRGWQIDETDLAKLRASAVGIGFSLLRDGETFSGDRTEARVEIHATTADANESTAHFEVSLSGEQLVKLRRLRDIGCTFAVLDCQFAILNEAGRVALTVPRDDSLKCTNIRQSGTTAWGDLIDRAHDEITRH